MKSYKHLVKYALSKKYTISVWDGEEWQVKYSKKYKNIIDAIESVDEAEIRIRDVHGVVAGWAFITAYGLADDETVIDHTLTEFMQEWNAQYEKLC